MKIILGTTLAICCGVLGYLFFLQKGFVNPYPAFCESVSRRIYLRQEQISKWRKICLRRSRLVSVLSPRYLIIKDMNNVLGLLNVSHLQVFDSRGVKSVWKGENRETGIESEFVDGELVIFMVHPLSYADQMGLRRGDVIKSINGAQPSPWTAREYEGDFEVERNQKIWTVALKTSLVQRREEMVLTSPQKDIGVVRVPSFRSEFMQEKDQLRLRSFLAEQKKIIIDLRGNSGGNFAAGLRFLSEVICQKNLIGEILRPRYNELPTGILPDSLVDQDQLDMFQRHSSLRLQTKDIPGCQKKPVKVLVDSKTASVAEMVAQALKEFLQAPIWGSSSGGQLLVGIWYPLPEVGPGVEISIPEGVYQSAKGHIIEGKGVQLDRVLYYYLRETQRGQDSWLLKALD